MTDTTAAPTEAPATPAAPTESAPAAPAIAWLPGADADAVGYVQTKGWQGPADAVKSYQNIEKLLGADRAGRTVVLPAGDDATEWAAVYERLGRPTGPDGYKLPIPEGADPEFAKAASAKFHELGISAKQAEALAAWWNGQAQGGAEASAAAAEAALAAEHQALAKDWGTGPESFMRRELARRASVALGLDEAAIDALEKVAGYSKTMKALAKMGDHLREHKAEGMDNLGSFGLTPEGARARRSQLMADADWRKRAMVAASAEWAEIQKLDGIIAAAAA